MTIQEKNAEIAKMLGWRMGHKNPTETRWKDDWFDTDEIRKTGKGGLEPLLFHSDANWQFEIIEWIENLKISKAGYAYFQMTKNNIWIYVYKNHTIHCVASFNGVENSKVTKKEAIFEALFQFSQYLKEKN